MRLANGLICCGLALSLLGCNSPSVPGSPGVPEPIRVVENPQTGERARFFREIPFKVPATYNEAEAIANWKKDQAKLGFTKEISPEEDRERLAELRKKNQQALKE